MADVLDLSHHNSVASWEVVRASGIVGIIHKASESTDYADPTYEARRVAAREAGLLWGAYHFLRPGDMKQQAKWFLACAVPGKDDLICADYEDDSLTLDDLEGFLGALEAAIGRRAVIYSGHLIKEQVGNRVIPTLAVHQLWIAQYTTASQPEWPRGTWPQYFLWQYTDSGNAPGVSGAVDCNHSPLEEAELRAAWNGTALPSPPQPDGEDIIVTVTIEAPPGVKVRIVQTEEANHGRT